MTTAPQASAGLADDLTRAGMRKLSLKEKISYGLGDFGNGFMFDLGQAYLLYFYTEMAGITPIAAAGVFAFTKIFDAFMDPVAGTFVDGRRNVGKNGRFRPVMMYSSIALAVLTVATFVTPNAGHDVNLVYAYVSYAAWGLLYSFTNVPYGSLASVMTQDSQQRAQLAAFRQAGSVGALLITGVAFMPIVVAVSGGAAHLTQAGYIAAAVAMAVVGVLGFFACYRGTTEAVTVVRDPSEKITPATFVRTVFTNRALLTLILMTVFSISAYNIMPAMMAYFSKYNLHSIELLSVINFFGIGSSIIAILAIPALVKRLGKRNTALLGFGIASVAALLNFLIPTNPYIFTALYALTFIGVALPNGVTWAMVSDVIDYGHWRTGVRREGITYSMFNFSRKIAQALAAGMAGLGLNIIGYRNNFTDGSMPPEQVNGVLNGIKGLQTLYPAIALALAALTLLLFYPLTEQKLLQVLAEIHQRDADEIARGEVTISELDGQAPATVTEAVTGDRPADSTRPTDPDAGDDRRRP
ncbi:MFS transporter [Nigerium massiliense]|uniref:MFS transporter n=1 Tax=Nigerium massiliense TaxID=1522317 RepID=UPI0009077B49|nr:MFS transporter [Nigerium massiliense]